MLGYVTFDERGAADRILTGIANRLIETGYRIAGAVQVNSDAGPAHKCDMDLFVIGPDQQVRISQNLGTLSKGCRLDPAGLEMAVGLVEQALEAQPQLLIVNKFGKQEIDGRGFRPVIGRALAMDIPVLTAVNGGSVDGFLSFAGDLAEKIEPAPEAVFQWANRQIL